VSLELVALAVLMGAVTWPSRALPLLAPGLDRLPPAVREWLAILGPATLASLAAVSTLVVTDPSGAVRLTLGVEALAVLSCVAIVAWRRNLLLGLLGAVVFVAVARLTGLA
jgi:branched-subunit amino acid transport protein